MRTILRLTGLFVILTAAACGDSSGPNSAISGTYTLRSINGENLPAVIWQAGDDRVQVTSGSRTLNASGSYNDVTNFLVSNGTSTFPDQATETGTYTQSGNTVTFRAKSGDVYNMTLSGNTLTQNFDDGATQLTLVYQK